LRTRGKKRKRKKKNRSVPGRSRGITYPRRHIFTSVFKLSIALSAAVPLWVLNIQGHGGVNNQDIQKSREFSHTLGEKGDVLLFGSKKKGEEADLFNRLAHSIAVLSFCPGGVTLFGQHWETQGQQEENMEESKKVNVKDEDAVQFLPEVQQAIGYRVRAAQLQVQADLLKRKADEILIPTMIIHAIGKLEHQYGTFQYVAPGKSSSLKKDRLKEHLVNAGVDSGVIADCFNRATEETERAEYIKFLIRDLPQDSGLELL
jgi:hypothetical protein